MEVEPTGQRGHMTTGRGQNGQGQIQKALMTSREIGYGEEVALTQPTRGLGSDVSWKTDISAFQGSQ